MSSVKWKVGLNSEFLYAYKSQFTRGEVNLREQNSQYGGRTKMESKKRDIVIKGAILGLARYLALEKFSGIHKNNPS